MRFIVQTAGDEITAEEIGDGFDNLDDALMCAKKNRAMVVDNETGAIVPGTNFSGVAIE